jgi:DHA1 family multidrug resistance protein-like MFS transporter
MKKYLNPEPWERTLYIMLFVQLVSTMGFSIIFPFFPLYVNELGTNTGLSLEFWAGMVFSTQAVTMMFASPIWGAVADRYGRKPMVVRATFGGAVLVLMMGFVRSAEELALVRALQGLVTGVVPAASALVAAAAPRDRTGYAMGVLQLGLWSGVAVGPLIGGFMADTWGFRSAFITTSVLLTIAGLMVWLGVEEVFEAKESKQKASAAFIGQWKSILFAPGVSLIYGARAMSWLGRTMLVPIIPLFVVTLMPAGATGISTFTGLVVGIAAATGTASAVYLGKLGDRVGHRQILVGSAAASAIFYAATFFVASPWHLLLFQALAGAAVGGITPAVSAMLARYTEPGQEGAVYGIDSSVAAAARAVAPLISTSIIIWVGLAGTFVIAGFLFLLTAAMAIRWLPNYKPAPKQPQAQAL